MEYKLFAAVNQTFDFPPEIKIALSKTQELKSFIKPMTRAERNNLKSSDLWPGRVIYNTTDSILEAWSSSEGWVKVLHSDYIPEKFPDPWDKFYNLPQDVRIALAKSDEFKTLIRPMTLTSKLLLDAAQKWDGRTIYNISEQKLEVLQPDATWSTIYLKDHLLNPMTYWNPSQRTSLTTVQRDALPEENKWFGRTIYNMTTTRFEYWTEENTWATEYMAYDKFLLIPKISNALEFKYVIVPMTNTQRDALTEDQKWVGRLIYNTTKDCLEVFKTSDNWVPVVTQTDLSSISSQLSNALEFKYVIVPMTNTQRDALAEDQKWVGRLIYNTTEDCLEVFKSSMLWVPVVKASELTKTSTDISESPEFVGLIPPLTNIQRDSLDESQRPYGKVIYNRSEKRLEIFKTSDTWIPVLDSENMKDGKKWTPELVDPSNLLPVRLITDYLDANQMYFPTDIYAKYFLLNKMITLMVRASFLRKYEELPPTISDENIKISLPFPKKTDSSFYIGPSMFSYHPKFLPQKHYNGIVKLDNDEQFLKFEYVNTDYKLLPLTYNNPSLVLKDDPNESMLLLDFSITYEIA